MQNYGLSHNSLQLELAVSEALQARQKYSQNGQLLTTPSPTEVIRDVYRNGNGSLRIDDNQDSFEQMFRAAAIRQPALAATPDG